MISFLTSLSLAFLGLILMSYFNEKVVKLPTEIGLMVIAVGLSLVLLFLQCLGITNIDQLPFAFDGMEFHELVMNGFLCFLLFSGSATIRFKDLTQDKFLISTLAFFSTLTATLVYAALCFKLGQLLNLNFSFLQACIIGSIVAPTDPIAAMSILKKVGLPHRISLVMEGESLFNDGIAVALFVTFSSLNAAPQAHPIAGFVETILLNIFGAIAIAIIISSILFYFFKHTSQKHLEILISLAAVTMAYSISEWSEVSAPTAAVVVGIFFATKMNELHEDNESYYENFYLFWKITDKILNGFLYILIGLAAILIHETHYFFLIVGASIVFGLIARYLSILLPIQLFSRRSSLKPENYTPDKKKKEGAAMSKLLTWCGLKGGICIALALGTKGAFTKEQYDFVVLGTYAIVAFSTIVQGLSIQPLYNRIKTNFY